MPYAATWTNANAQGRLDAGEQTVCFCDADELADAVNRRRMLTYQEPQDFTSDVAAGLWVRARTLATAETPPFDNLRDALAGKIIDAPTGTLGGSPATPAAMDWLWPVAGEDENKLIVSGAAGAGEISLLEKLNGTDDWTDAVLTAGQTAIRAVHFNELRQVAEWLRRGRWRLPVYFGNGLYSPLPDTPWLGDLIANNGTHELRSLGFAVLRTGEVPDLGLTEVTARPGSYLEITTNLNCTVEVYRCLRAVDFIDDAATWNDYDPSASAGWTAPGGTGAGDAVYVGSVSLTAGVAGSLSGANLAAALQAMIDGAEQNLLVRRGDTGPESIAIAGTLVVEFDLDSPPN